MEFKAGKKEFRIVDFENELNLDQGELGAKLFLEVVNGLGKSNTDTITATELMKRSNDVLGNNTKAEIIAVCSWEKTENGFEWIPENLSENIDLIKRNLTYGQLKKMEKIFSDFFTFIPQFTMGGFQMLSQAMTKVTKQITGNSKKGA